MYNGQGTGGLLGAHSSYNVSIFGGSGNFGIMNASLCADIFRSWGGDGLEIAAVVRKPPPNESTVGQWVRTVDGETVVVVPDKPAGLLRFSSKGQQLQVGGAASRSSGAAQQKELHIADSFVRDGKPKITDYAVAN